MRRIKLFGLLILALFSAALQSQTDERILLRIDDTGVTAEEFVRLFTKNDAAAEETDFDDYFNQFLIFRLKVEQAMDEGIDTTLAFRKEFEGYRSQLARNYLTDGEAREKLLRDAYSRLQYELNALHILVGCRPEDSPADTAAAYKKAIEIRVRIIEGEPFDQVARAVSDDPSSITNGGNLGWFTAMQMILPFEEAVYSMKPGDVSMPVRTPYGYHIIKLVGRRPTPGRIKVAHIMKALPPGATEQAWNEAANEIKRIHQTLSEGADFSEVAKAESDHRESAMNGGELEWFGPGDIVPEFSDAAFSLLRNGDISEPVKTPYGWHIIKRIDRRALGTFEENRSMLESRLSESHLNSIAKKSMVEKLKKEYNFYLNAENLNWFITTTDTLILSGKNKLSGSSLPAGVLFEFDGGSMTCREFAAVVESNIEAFDGTNAFGIINRLIESKVSEIILAWEESRLEQKYPDFRYLVKEFHDGMLLFEINSREVWNRPYSDTTGLSDYYNTNISLFMGNPSADVTIYSLKESNPKIKNLSRLVAKYGSKPYGNERILEKYTSNGDTLLVITSGRWYQGDDPQLDRHLRKRGSDNIIWNGMQSVLVVSRVYEAEPIPFQEARPEAASLYQDYLEATWVEQLKSKYNVWVNEKLLEELRVKFDGKK
ncbi:MAG: peptidylprolyl isomerase [Bacteroidales bacterium]|nr:peptidylprolyl isomerase [Bacteroidales bacterium]